MQRAAAANQHTRLVSETGKLFGNLRIVGHGIHRRIGHCFYSASRMIARNQSNYILLSFVQGRRSLEVTST
jgi:hypothetical protein